MTSEQEQVRREKAEVAKPPVENNVYEFPPRKRQEASEETTLLELEKALHNWF